jgi:hypothetical protein
MLIGSIPELRFFVAVSHPQNRFTWAVFPIGKAAGDLVSWLL